MPEQRVIVAERLNGRLTGQAREVSQSEADEYLATDAEASTYGTWAAFEDARAAEEDR